MIGKKICKVCGAEYEACHTLRQNLNNEFRWQDVACSPEHGAEYLRRVLEARAKNDAPPAAEVTADVVAEAPVEEPKKTTRKRSKKQTAE